MPVEIKELIIRATITGDSEEGRPEPGDTVGSPDREEIISACVDQVLKIIERSKER